MDIDWYKHYLTKKSIIFTDDTFRKNLETDRPYIELLKKHLRPNANILECGCGLGRAIVSMSISGFNVMAIDKNPKMIEIAKMNSKYGKGIKFKLMDFLDIDKNFKEATFDCCTHQGILEHYNEGRIKMIIEKQLKVANYVIFTVPLKTDFNKNYFNDKLYRNLWEPEYWIGTVLKDFNIVEHKQARQRTDNLLVVIKK